MNGVVVLNKPQGKTSHDMVYAIRKLFNIRRVGHTGTLDPNATGVLPICIGNATKAASYITDSKKRYVAELILGSRTDTLDSTGEVLQSAPVLVTREQLFDACKHFVGDIEQIPPMYSAIKIDGKKLYELAREGKSVERKSRSISIYSIKIDDSEIEKGRATLFVECSKGTYIRSLCDDIGQWLGCFAHMGSLVRTYSGGFDIKESYTIEQLELMRDRGNLMDALIKTDEIFGEYEKIVLNKKDADKVRNGVSLSRDNLLNDKCYRLYDENGDFLCVSRQNNGILKMQTSFWT